MNERNRFAVCSFVHDADDADGPTDGRTDDAQKPRPSSVVDAASSAETTRRVTVSSITVVDISIVSHQSSSHPSRRLDDDAWTLAPYTNGCVMRRCVDDAFDREPSLHREEEEEGGAFTMSARGVFIHSFVRRAERREG